MRTYSASGIVLRRIDLGEKDRILTVYTKELGKLSAVAKGCQQQGSKLSGASEPLTYSKMLLAAGRDLDVLTQADIKESFPNARTGMDAIAYGVYMLELMSQFVDERQPNADLFDTLLSALYILESGADAELTARYFELQLLGLLGYEPHFDGCMRCECAIGLEKVAFSPALGGIVCADCGTVPNDALWIPGALASYVRALRQCEPHKLAELKLPAGARRDLSHVLRRHIRYRLERELKSVEFLRVISH